MVGESDNADDEVDDEVDDEMDDEVDDVLKAKGTRRGKEADHLAFSSSSSDERLRVTTKK